MLWRLTNEPIPQTDTPRHDRISVYRNYNTNFLVCTVMITAQKARNIQMLCIGEQSDRTYHEILEASIKGKTKTSIPHEFMADWEADELIDRGYKVNYNDPLGEYEISWDK